MHHRGTLVLRWQMVDDLYKDQNLDNQAIATRRYIGIVIPSAQEKKIDVVVHKCGDSQRVTSLKGHAL